jgi:ureidoglycolate lyase
MNRRITLKPHPLTEDAFAPFGTIVHNVQSARPQVVVGELWHGTLRQRPGNLRITTLNRHRDAEQVIIPQNGVSTIFVVGRPGERLSEGDVAAFLSDGTQGVCLGVGTWHTGPIPLDQPESYSNIQGSEWAQYTDEINFAVRHNIEFHIEI